MKKCVLHVYLFILIHLSTVSPSLPLSSYISLSPIFPSLHSSNGSTVLVPGSEICPIKDTRPVGCGMI